MKKILLTLSLLLCLTGCNKQVFDTTYNYNYAIISVGSKTTKIRISSWRDYEDGDQLQITDENGTVYLLHSNNVILVHGDTELLEGK